MCIQPSFIFIERGPNWVQQAVPCKTCWRCRSNRVNDYVGRSLCEASTSDWTVALTLTYAPRDDLADKIITPSHFQAFVRSLRRRGHKLRYLAVGEYGDLRGRAHFHCVLFGKGKRPEIPNKKNASIPSWPHGHVFADWDADEKSLRYVCKYVLKGEPGKHWFTLSKKPPLGAEWFARKAQLSVELGVLPSGFDYLPPNGQKGRPYLMTQATRRDYIAAVTDAWIKERPLDRKRLSEWVLKALESLDTYRHRRAVECLDPQLVLEGIREDLDRQRPSDRAVQSELLWTDYNLTN